MKSKKILCLALAALLLLNLMCPTAFAAGSGTGFRLVSSEQSASMGGTVRHYKHIKTGADVVWLDNNSDRREFVIGFKTPPIDSKGANHVLEHCLLCGGEKYPTKNIMHYIQQGTSSLFTNGVTEGDSTSYLFRTQNQTEYYNIMDVYLDCVFHPLFLNDENIFRQQGIRLEYVNGKVQYNGVVFSEMRMNNVDSETSAINFMVDKMIDGIYGDTPPAYFAGGAVDEIKKLTYEDVLKVYKTYYVPANSMTYLAGKQDINKTLKMLDAVFSEYDSAKPDITFADTKKVPAKEINEYNITANTKTVDIGFMTSGIPLWGDFKELHARDILINMIYARLNQLNGNNYIEGDEAGGISRISLITSHVPIAQKDAIIKGYKDYINQLAEGGVSADEIDRAIVKHFDELREAGSYGMHTFDDEIFNGLKYFNDPMACSDLNGVEKYLRENKGYITEVLKKYFIDNPSKIIAVAGDGAAKRTSDIVSVSAAELEKIKQQTAEFQQWADAEDPSEVVEKIPFLTKNEVKNPPATQTPAHDENEGISFYYTAKGDGSASLYFPLDVSDDDLLYVQMLCSFVNSKLDGVAHLGLTPMENDADNNKMNPQLLIYFGGEDKTAALDKVRECLKDDKIWNTSELRQYIDTAMKQLKQGYRDPYMVSYELKQSTLSAGNRLYAYAFAYNGEGSMQFYRLLKSIKNEQLPTVAKKLQSLGNHIILTGKPTVEYNGDEGFAEFKQAVSKAFASGEQRQSNDFRMPIGYPSAATISSQPDARHFMLTAYYDKSKSSGKLEVLGKVLATKYLLPTMRGKHGAYGAGISFYGNDCTMTSSTAGLADLDVAVQVWQGMGDYLRNLKMTQKELDAIIVATVFGYDEWDYMQSESGASMFLTGSKVDKYDKYRNEMLSTTVQDLKNYADFVDELVAQNRIFAVVSKAEAEQSKVDFAYYADPDTFDVVPRLTKNAKGYIGGVGNNLFAPNANITRAEAAAIISKLMADDREISDGNKEFADVAAAAWYNKPVQDMYVKGIMSGYEGNLFKPEQSITRAEFAAMLSKFIFRGDGALKGNYKDVSKSAWYAEPMAKMVNAGYLTGYSDKTLRPNAKVTRAEAVVIINRMIGLKAGNSDKKFSDVPAKYWASSAIQAAAE